MLSFGEEASKDFESFCGSELWNTTLSWNTGNESLPDFTTCFQQTIVSWVPCGFLWITLPFYIYYLSREKPEYVQKFTAFSGTKSILALLLAALSLFDLGYSVAVRYYNKDVDSYLYIPASAYVSYSLDIVSMMAAAVLIQQYRLKGHFSSGVMWCYWGLWLIFSVVPVYSEILHSVDVGKIDDIPEFVTKTTYFVLCLTQFILACISDANAETMERYENICPEVIGSFSSFLMFSWLSPLISLGYRRDLEQDDLFGLGPDNTSKGHVPAFEADWNIAVATWKNQKENNQRPLHLSGIIEVSGSAAPLVETHTASKEPSLSLSRIIMKHYGGHLLASFACKLAYDCIQFTGPLLQSVLIDFIAARNSELGPDVAIPPAWQGYVYAILLFVTQLIITILFQQLWYLSVEVGMRVRTSIISIIYKKALIMSSEAKQQSTVGEIVNLMAVDAQRMQDVFTYLWMLWSAPLQIAIAVWFLYITIGPSLFLGLALMLIAIPINACVAMYQKNVQVEQMNLKDERIKIMNEVLGGIKVIKLYAWEPSFQEKIATLRKNEMVAIAKSWMCTVIQFSTFASLPSLVSAAVYAMYVCTEESHILGSNEAFVTLSLFNILRGPLFQLPMALSYTVMANVSIKRIEAFFKNTDLSGGNVEKDDDCDVSLRVTDGTFSWLPDSQKILCNVNFEVPTDSLTAVVGQVGSGKSSLLAACVGDMHKHSGKVVTKGSVAFVAQQPWIQNATVRDNILFGKPFDQEKYDEVVEAVALKSDFKILDDGDQTWIGEKGINLSGGQKQRVSLARACYSGCDLYLFDDPLSAVDAHVGKHIFENVIGPNGILQRKTRVLVTHGLQWLPEVDNIVVLSNNRVTETGSYENLLAQKGPFATFISAFAMSAKRAASVDQEDDEAPPLSPLSPDLRLHRQDSAGVFIESVNKMDQFQRQASLSILFSMSMNQVDLEATQATPAALREDAVPVMDQEVMGSGEISNAVYKLYFRSMGALWLTATIVFVTILTILTIVSSVWLTMWTDDEMFLPATTGNYTADEIWAQTLYYMLIFLLLAASTCVFTYCLSKSFSKCSINSSEYLHKMLLSRIFKVQMMFYDTKPLGQILNRFSKDIDAIDNVLGITVQSMLFTLLVVFSTAIIIVYSAPAFIILVIPLGACYYLLQRYFIRTTRQLKRMEAVTRSPIFTHFSETVTGAETIRAFGVQERFIQKSEDMVEDNVLFFYAGWAANRWLAVRLQALSALVVGLASAFCVMSTQVAFLQDHISSSLVGLALSYALVITKSLDTLLRSLTDLETNVVSIERVKEYSEVDLEAEWMDFDDPPPSQWPAKGQIQFRRYATRYRPDLDLVLKELDFTIKPLEKIGIVGRTGAGKSSMTLALFRLIEAARGSIYIDGVNIGAIGLHQLRNKITILPQDPLIFSGNVRENLDPFNEYSDDKIWEVLEQSFLKEYVERQAEKLGYECGEGGENLSVGQRQLICLARALLRKTKILVLDEATAAVDVETDNLIQETIRTQFADCTILTIAHRLKTITDSDRILVLDQGKVAEFDTPENLLDDKDGIFYGMAKEAGII